MNNKTKISIIVIGAFLVAGLAMWGGELPSMGEALPSTSGDSVAVVNGEKISRQDFEIYKEEARRRIPTQQGENELSAEEIEQRAEDNAINQLIERVLLLQAARDAGFEMDDEKVEEQYQQTIQQVGGEEELQKRLQESGISEEKLREDLGEHMMIQEYVRAEMEKDDGGVEITDDEAQNRYDQLTAGQEEAPPFDQVKEQIKSQLRTQEENEFVLNLVTELKDKAEIERSL